MFPRPLEGRLRQPHKSHATVIALIVGGVLVAGVVGFLVVRSRVSGLVTAGRQTLAQGESLGRSLTAAACLDTAFARHAALKSPSFTTLIGERLFLNGCLRASQPSPDLCADVPRQRDFARAVAWTIEQCRIRAPADRNCSNLLQSLLEYCDRRTRQQG